jgi:hypothetical protein
MTYKHVCIDHQRDFAPPRAAADDGHRFRKPRQLCAACSPELIAASRQFQYAAKCLTNDYRLEAWRRLARLVELRRDPATTLKWFSLLRFRLGGTDACKMHAPCSRAQALPIVGRTAGGLGASLPCNPARSLPRYLRKNDLAVTDGNMEPSMSTSLTAKNTRQRSLSAG